MSRLDNSLCSTKYKRNLITWHPNTACAITVGRKGAPVCLLYVHRPVCLTSPNRIFDRRGIPPKPGGYSRRQPKNPDEILSDFHATHTAHSLCATTFSCGAALACLDAPHPSLPPPPEVRFLICPHNISITSVCTPVVPYPGDQVLEELAGSFAFVVYDNKTGAVFTALVRTCILNVLDLFNMATRHLTRSSSSIGQSSDGGVPLSIVICDDVETIKESCGSVPYWYGGNLCGYCYRPI
ncbi:hypothetical protein GW17_00002583 [Ensete ventricosum]|nr:hypothetical protein GW17_00002583 [Ensete ventricosum]